MQCLGAHACVTIGAKNRPAYSDTGTIFSCKIINKISRVSAKVNTENNYLQIKREKRERKKIVKKNIFGAERKKIAMVSMATVFFHPGACTIKLFTVVIYEFY
jgi:hypothetical protein